ncbi:tetratricopeptide repeat protein [Aestuariivirga sp.]|uniref:tetratricopeptide repeat protein n=1 Tax=Aestuariivirga sp. TaxID=2650926 RepID=UPI0035934EBB
MARCGRYIAILFALASATALAGCKQSSSSLDSSSDLSTASTSVPVSYEATAELSKKWESDPKNVSKGLAYANALESIGQSKKQLEVYRKLVALNPANTKLASLYGRKLVSIGRSNEAVPVLERAAQSGDADWRTHSALGSAYDQQGLYQKARAEYQKALTLDPQNLSVQNNMGMSFALEGDLKQAETTLRQADAIPRSKTEPRIRQNLALVVGLQGRFDEASKLASEDLPAEQVQENMAYLQKMLSQPNTWQQISEGASG